MLTSERSRSDYRQCDRITSPTLRELRRGHEVHRTTSTLPGWPPPTNEPIGVDPARQYIAWIRARRPGAGRDGGDAACAVSQC